MTHHIFKNARYASALPLISLSLLFWHPTSGFAQEASTYKEQGKLIHAPRDIATLGSDLFGDKVNLYTGSLEFVQTDVSLPGNNALPVAVGRRLVVGQAGLNGTLFGKWDLEIPHLHGVFASVGWQAGLGTDRNARCSAFGRPPNSTGSFGSNSSWNATEFWHGSFLYVPGIGDQEMLQRSATNTQAPGGSPTSYPVVTRNNWAIRCLPSMASGNGALGEAFVAVSPDGIEYRFDWLVQRSLPYLTKTNSGPQSGMMAPSTDLATTSKATATSSTDSAMSSKATIAEPAMSGGGGGGGVFTPNSIQGNALARTEVWILPTRVTDRFGNTVTYIYDTTNKWQLTSIVANDASESARAITLSYATPGSVASNLVTSVSDGTRTWTYAYDNISTENLISVTLPDGSSWKQMNAISPLLADIDYQSEGSCEIPGYLAVAAATGYMIHPSGARGDFTLSPTSHGRSGVEYRCDVDPYYQTYTPFYPKIFDTYALTRKSLTSPGSNQPATEWLTSYAPEASSWGPCNGCNASTQVEVKDPAGNTTRFTFGTLFRETEGQLQQTEVLDEYRNVIRTTYQQYTDPIQPLGYSDQRRGDGEMSARVSETNRRQITQQGVDFVWQANSFDGFAKPTQVTRSSGANSRTENTVYENNLGKWVLGQVRSVTEASTGKVMVLNSYNATTAALESVSKFGRLVQTMGYNADGTVATRSDPLGYTTRFFNYKRGVPRNVTFADNNSESAVVDNLGNFSSVTDAAGFTTTFGYTAGRLSSIVYPAGGPVAWNNTTLSFAPVGAAEYDLPAGHWKQTVSTGNATTTRFFDALWRPVYTLTVDNGDPTTASLVKRQFDFSGHTTFESYPKQSVADIGDGVHTEYDGLGRVTASGANSELGLLWTRSSYIDGFQKSQTDARGHVTTTSFQAFDEPSETAVAGISAPLGVSLAIARDVFGKTKSITRAGAGLSATRSYVYDGNERLCKTIEPETGATVQEYDAADNVLWRASGNALPSTTSCDTTSVAASRKVTFGYDAMNRLQTTSYADGSPAISRSYTADGLPSTVTSGGTVWTSGYDNRRNNISESMTYGGGTYNIARAYDANGSLSLLTYPDQSSVDYAPNALGQPTRAGAFASGVTYHPNGAIARFTYGNGIVHTMTPNPRGLPGVSSDAGILNDSYTYDENANVKSITDQQEGVSTRAMAYDDLDRLTATTSAATFGTVTNIYDTLDNLINVTVTQGPTARSTTHNFDPATNRLTSIASATGAYNLGYGYDIQGNITTRGGRGFVFDQGNRMQSAAGVATYAYDGLGHRVSTVGLDGVNRVSVYTQGGQLLYMRSTSVPLATGTKYIYLGRHQIAEVKAARAN